MTAPTSATAIVGDLLRDAKVLDIRTLARRSGFSIGVCAQVVRSLGGCAINGRAQIAPRTRPTVYIAAPYRADTTEERIANVHRARRLAAAAHFEGFAPVYVHDWVELGLFGPDDDEDARRDGLRTACAIAASCDHIWVVRREDGTLSHGVSLEAEAWRCAHPTGTITTI